MSKDVTFLEKQSYFHLDRFQGESTRKEGSPPLMLVDFSLGPQVGSESEKDYEKESQLTKSTQDEVDVRFGKIL